MELKPIPGTRGYMADTDGNIYDASGRLRPTYRNGDGYISVAVKTESGKFSTFGVQRLVALAHLPEDIPERDQVNHRDSNKENNCYTNLEWVTQTENQIHAKIMRLDNQYPTVLAMFVDGSRKLYLNAYVAASDNECSPGDVWDSIKDNCGFRMIRFEHIGFSAPLPEELRKSTGMIPGQKAPEAKAIKLFDTETGEISVHESIAEAGRLHGVNASHIYQSLSKPGKLRLFKKRYQAVYADEDFPEIPQEVLEKMRNHGPKEVIAFDHSTGRFLLSPTAKKFIEEFGLSKKAVASTLASSRLRRIEQFTPVYFNDVNFKRLQEHVGNPVPTALDF